MDSEIKSDRVVLVFCSFRFTAIHHWEKAPTTVAFLRDPHRHDFHVKAYKQVKHLDRDVEFITLKKQMKLYCREAYEDKEFEYSCEMIANDLVDTFNLCECEVSEDGENGAVVFVEPKE